LEENSKKQLVKKLSLAQQRIADLEKAELAQYYLAAIVESATDSIIGINLEGIVISWNASSEKLFGYSASEIIGKPINILVPPNLLNANQILLDKIKQGHSLEPYDTIRVRKDGNHIPVSLTSFPVKDKSGNTIGISKIIQDITERKRTEAQLQAFARALERSNQELQDFATVASHDLQEPLRKIQAFSDELKEECGYSLSPDASYCLERLRDAATRMRALINSLLVLARVSTKPQPFIKLELNKVVQEILFDLGIQIQQINAQVEVSTLPIIEADPIQIRQLLQNLISNSLKFHKQGQPPIIKIYSKLVDEPNILLVPASQHNKCYQISIEDNGIGFDEKYLHKIFVIFQRLHARDEYEGTGVGLALCRKIVERHGGSITAKSNLGQGATFIITLPAQQIKKEDISNGK